jgi:hypothetical protein
MTVFPVTLNAIGSLLRPRLALRAGAAAAINLLRVSPLVLPVWAALPSSTAHSLTLASTVCSITFVEVPVVSPRLLVRCDAPAAGTKIEYFALHLGKQLERAKLVLSVLMTAKAANRPVRIYYHSDDTSASAWDMGCNPSDCRPILAVGLL